MQKRSSTRRSSTSRKESELVRDSISRLRLTRKEWIKLYLSFRRTPFQRKYCAEMKRRIRCRTSSLKALKAKETPSPCVSLQFLNVLEVFKNSLW
jgi:hypothetical protein